MTTDSLYVHNYEGQGYGASLLVLSTVLILFLRSRENQEMQGILPVVILTWGLTIWLSFDGSFRFPHDGMDIPLHIQEGLYFSKQGVKGNDLPARIAHFWSEETRVYGSDATKWTPTGDSRTGIPFLLNTLGEMPHFVRVWVGNPQKDGDEVFGLGIAFPRRNDGTYFHSPSKPLYIVLHGLTGGTHELLIVDFVKRCLAEGSTAIVMIARGLMDTPVMGWDMFHGARVSDIAAAAGVVKNAVSKVYQQRQHEQGVKRAQPVVGVGYSMGGIVLNNYVARSGTSCDLDAAISVSGGLDMKEQMSFPRGRRLWEPLLVERLRDEVILGKFGNRAKARLGHANMLAFQRAASIQALDAHSTAVYNGYRNVKHYYSEMSAMGDFESIESVGRIGNVSIPLCIFHALDDPLITWRAVAKIPPDVMVETGHGSLMFLLTKSGGHVGWPLGWNPTKEAWAFMNNAGIHFGNAVQLALEEKAKN
eukprot:CAMPEP_0118681904 /NCGR_PEP_ID=MMETSP0800-20121206/5196_1 /TAXON_ID=210618 ORGANISM="Striatella unipunctata, Strain CCMP2910" /NCGR_SAMPLE_ID=MMETSP0800 /ASSEMBLY_ACC=CAM_ASM_000638 /LENGTH=476 /DNA_ID=CAMNT_0006578249 /DNA_START=344 /DNA_END=1774 /DNA_ORIENTATION=+